MSHSDAHFRALAFLYLPLRVDLHRLTPEERTLYTTACATTVFALCCGWNRSTAVSSGYRIVFSTLSA